MQPDRRNPARLRGRAGEQPASARGDGKGRHVVRRRVEQDLGDGAEALSRADADDSQSVDVIRVHHGGNSIWRWPGRGSSPVDRVTFRTAYGVQLPQLTARTTVRALRGTPTQDQ